MHSAPYSSQYMLMVYPLNQDSASSRQQRKSVAFSEGTTVVDGNGNVTEMNGTSRKQSAESHTACQCFKLYSLRSC